MQATDPTVEFLLKQVRESPAVKDAKASMRRHRYYLSPSERKREKSKQAHRHKPRHVVHDPDIQDKLNALRKKKKSRGRQTFTARKASRSQAYRLSQAHKFQNRRNPFGRGSLVILVFQDDNNDKLELLIQRDTQDDGSPKPAYGFVIGSPDEKTELDKDAGLREVEEETGISRDIGEIKHIGDMHVKSDYYIAVFVKKVPFSTVHTPGNEIFKFNGKPCQDRYTLPQVVAMMDLLLPNHAAALQLALSKNCF